MKLYFNQRTAESTVSSNNKNKRTEQLNKHDVDHGERTKSIDTRLAEVKEKKTKEQLSPFDQK